MRRAVRGLGLRRRAASDAAPSPGVTTRETGKECETKSEVTSPHHPIPVEPDVPAVPRSTPLKRHETDAVVGRLSLLGGGFGEPPQEDTPGGRPLTGEGAMGAAPALRVFREGAPVCTG